VVCSHCGNKSSATHRFCGMCGTPLPQRPITAPGATSTLSFTRLPVEVPRFTGPGTSALTSPASSVLERSSPALMSSGTEVAATAVKDVASPADSHLEKPNPELRSTDPQSRNYFTEAEKANSLEQFVAGFHYAPPKEEDELTMTGDHPVLDATGKYGEPVTPIGLSEESLTTEAPTQRVTSGSWAEGVSVSEGSAAETSAPGRSRFLDLSEQANQPTAVSSAPIAGPSFLGLSDSALTGSVEALEEPSTRSHWRAWVALIVILLFGGLGYLEWRAEKNQSNTGPIGVMKMQIERLKGRKGAVVTPEPSTQSTSVVPEAGSASNNSQPNASGPDMQVTPQQKQQTPAPVEPGTNANPPAEKPASPGASASPATIAPAQASSNPVQAAPGGSSNTGTFDAGRTQASDTNPSLPSAAAGVQPSNNGSKPASAQNEEAPAREPSRPAKPMPGADELAKANDASDAAAASAWLWKSVAKGNPEAPVRLANMYIKGDGVARSCEQAVVLLKSAAAKENAGARSRLGTLYATGTCVPRDRVRAYEYMSSALQANPNASGARDLREQLWAQMSPQERTQAEKYR